ncbi:MAG: YceI family protein [Bacteroidia bacterium]
MKKLWILVAASIFAVSCSNSGNKAENTEVVDAIDAGESAVLPVNESKLKWTGKKLTGEHFGTIGITDGSLFFDGANLTGGNFVIDMTTIVVEDLEDEEYNKKLTDHLYSEDFFNVENHKEGRFEITGIEAMEMADEAGNTHLISGNLTIKGITNGIKFPARVSMNDDGVNATAKFDIDRTLWDIKYRSGKIFPDIGDKVIYDEIGIELELSANRS